MKIMINTVMLICLFSFFGSTEKCPQKGDSTNLGHQEMDLLKNRKTSSKKINKGITLEKILKKGDDRKRFKNSDYVEITGYVYDVKWGGAETCNCHSKNKEDLDIHIKIVKEMSSASNRKSMVAEITRYSRGNYTYSEIKEMKGKKVKLKGWMFFDDEHDQNSVNTNPDGSFIWRATSWEIHPCQLIELN